MPLADSCCGNQKPLIGPGRETKLGRHLRLVWSRNRHFSAGAWDVAHEARRDRAMTSQALQVEGSLCFRARMASNGTRFRGERTRRERKRLGQRANRRRSTESPLAAHHRSWPRRARIGNISQALRADSRMPRQDSTRTSFCAELLSSPRQSLGREGNERGVLPRVLIGRRSELVALRGDLLSMQVELATRRSKLTS